jgi:hypothetical protein
MVESQISNLLVAGSIPVSRSSFFTHNHTLADYRKLRLESFLGGQKMPELVTIPISYFAVVIDYESPHFKLWLDRANIVQAVFNSLKSWLPCIDDVDPVTTGMPSEQGFTIKLPLKRVSIFFGPASFKFTRDSVDWQSAEETFAILDSAVTALVDVCEVILGPKRTTIAVHLQPKTTSFVDLLAPFVPHQLATLNSDPILTMATVAKWAGRKITIDGSGVVANGLFLRFEREFPTEIAYDSIARQLKSDQDELFGILGVEEDRL